MQDYSNIERRTGARGDFYRFIRYLVLSVFKIFLRLKVEGQRNVPQEGGVILASNHCSFFDPPLVAVATRRPVHFLAKKELFDHWGFGALIRALSAFPVSRGFGRKAIETVLRTLREDRAVLLFPEGTRQRSGTLGQAKAGVGMIAVKAGKPIVPVWVSGSLHAWRAFAGLGRIRVCFGRPIQPEEFRTAEIARQRYQVIGDQVMEAIGRMAGQSMSNEQ